MPVNPDALALPAQYGLIGLLIFVLWRAGPHFVEFIQAFKGLESQQAELRKDIDRTQTDLRAHMDTNTQQIVSAIEKTNKHPTLSVTGTED